MFAILIVLTLVPLTLLVACYRQRLGVGECLREAVLVASTLWAVLVVAFTELLSLGRLLRFGPVLSCWAVALLVLLAWVVWQRDRLRGWRWLVPPKGPWEWVLLGLCAVPVVAAGVCAAWTPPNNADSLNYHLPRQIYWMQQASVAHFPPTSYHQLLMPPLAEFIGVHLMILSGGDGWANLVQWFSWVLTLNAVSLIARELGLNRAGQLLAALFVVTIPMAFLEALNTKNDLVVSLWLCSAAWWSVRLWAGKPWSLAQAVLFGVAMGLMGLTKGTGYLFAVPIAVAAGLGLLIHQRRLILPATALAGVVAVLLNAGHWTRNYALFHAFSRPGFAALHNNATFQPQALASNLIRNLALHVGTSGDVWNRHLTDAVAVVHRWLGIDMNDPRTTYLADYAPAPTRFTVCKPLRHEDCAAAPVHVVGLLVLTVLLPFWRKRFSAAGWAYLAMTYGCILLFCLALKWQPWHSRLHLPILCLGAVILADGCRRLGKPLTALGVAGCVAVLVPFIEKGNPKPLFTARSVFRQDRLAVQLNTSPPATGEALCGLVRDVAACHPHTIGLCWLGWQMEYLVERALLDASRQPLFFANFQALADVPPSPKMDPRWFEAPDVVVAHMATSMILVHPFTHVVYQAVAQHFPYTVYLPREIAQATAFDDTPMSFLGWEGATGWSDIVGPFPQWGLPFVRWGLAPGSSLDFTSDGKPMELVAECRGNSFSDQVMTVVLNGTVIHQQAFDGSAEFSCLRVPLPARSGTNQLKFRYRRGEEVQSGDRHAVLFRRLVIRPQSASEN